MDRVNLGILGGGTVGGGVYLALQRNGGLLTSRTGMEFRIRKIAVRDLARPRAVKIPKRLLTDNWREVVDDPKIQVVLELMGGVSTAREAILAAFASGKAVVTANKALISEHGEELFEAARLAGVNLYYEASVAGGIPIIKVLREALTANRITRIYGIINGTCNYILSRMKLEGADFNEVLREAQQLGYAEAEPSLDIDGWDAFHKIGIMASLAHGFWVNPKQIHLEGITHVSQQDIQFAERLGYTIRLLGIVKLLNPEDFAKPGKDSRPLVQVSVYPALVPNEHVLASVNGVFNAVLVRGDVVGDTLYYGAGAGQDATASAVVSDIIDAGLDLKHKSHERIPAFTPHEKDGSVLPMEEVVCQYYLRLNIIDVPGTLAQIATILGKANIGISSVIQPEGNYGKDVPLILMIHDARNADMQAALQQISDLKVVRGKPTMIRVEHFD